MDIEDVRRRLMLSITGALAACGPVLPDVGDGSAGGSAGASSGSASDTSATSTSGSATRATSADADVGETSDMRFDIGSNADAPALDCPAQPMAPVQECMAPLPEGWDSPYFVFYCVDVPAGESCESWAAGFDRSQGEAINQCLPTRDACFGHYVLEIGCGPLPDLGDQCCFWFTAVANQFCPGRPFVVAGAERLAELCERSDWAAQDTPRAQASAPERAALAAAWAEQALFEHASVASFSRFILQLLSCGAPARLLAAAQVALGEEIEHARLFFAFASGYAGRPVGPATLATHDALAGGEDFDEIVLCTVREGCIAETISAWHVALAAQAVRDPAMAAALARVAEQELEHAALAWRFLAWALPRAGEPLRGRIDAMLRAPARFAPRGLALSDSLSDPEWLAHGILPAARHAAATEQALRELVVPLARTLAIAPSPSARSRPEAQREAGVT